jgi:hypothetical protein
MNRSVSGKSSKMGAEGAGMKSQFSRESVFNNFHQGLAMGLMRLLRVMMSGGDGSGGPCVKWLFVSPYGKSLKPESAIVASL